MASANVVFIMGNLTRDPVSRDTKGGTVCDLGVAINESYTDKAGVRKESTVYVDVVVWGKTAEHFAPNLTKGTRVVVFGDLEQESWEDKATGQKRSKHKVKAREIGLLSMGERRESQQEAAYSGGSDGMPF